MQGRACPVFKKMQTKKLVATRHCAKFHDRLVYNGKFSDFSLFEPSCVNRLKFMFASTKRLFSDVVKSNKIMKQKISNRVPTGAPVVVSHVRKSVYKHDVKKGKLQSL